MKNYLITLSIFLLFANFANGKDKEVVPIGIIAPLTGNASHIGDEITRTVKVMELVLKSKNTNYNYNFLLENGNAALDNSPTKAFNYLLNVKKIKFLVSATSGETLQVAPLAQAKGILTFAVISSHQDVKKIGDFVFRTFIDVERGMTLIAKQFINDKNIPIAILTEDHSFTQGIKKLLLKNLSSNMVYTEDYIESSTDLKPVLLKAKFSGVKAYYFNCAHPITCSLIVNQAKQLGIKEQIYSYFHTDNPAFLKATKDTSEGIKFLSPPDISKVSDEFKEFLKLYKKEHKSVPENDFLLRTTYDALNCIIKGVESVGQNSDKVKKFLNSYKKLGALGMVSFDKNGDIENINYIMKEIRNGKPKNIL